MIITDNLFDEVLIKPVEEGADGLSIISGYATATMASRHLDELINNKKQHIKINIIAGMYIRDGLKRSNHEAFKQLVTEGYPTHIECNYMKILPPVHSKVYIWTKKEKPFLAFTGSANYTQNAFFSGRQREVLSECDALSSLDYFKRLLKESVECRDDIRKYLSLYDWERTVRGAEEKIDFEKEIDAKNSALKNLPHMKVSLIDRSGNVPAKSGLNWGQRDGRDHNQAYLSLRSSERDSGFFPERPQQFIIETDDGKLLLCARAQEKSKAIHTVQKNSLMGEYFRNRLGLASGEFVKREHLQKYGRTDVAFYKIDEESYYMDFSVRSSDEV